MACSQEALEGDISFSQATIKDGRVHIRRKRRGHPDCTKESSYGVFVRKK